MQALEIQGIKMQALLMQCIISSVSAIQHALLFQRHMALFFFHTIPFKSQLRSRHDGFAIYTVEFASTKTEHISREETELLMREQIGSLILIHAMTIHYDM